MFEEPSGFMTEENYCKMHGTGPKRHEVLLPWLPSTTGILLDQKSDLSLLEVKRIMEMVRLKGPLLSKFSLWETGWG